MVEAVYKPRSSKTSPLYRSISDHFSEFESAYEGRYQKRHGVLQDVVREVVYKYLGCGDLRKGFARIKYFRDRLQGEKREMFYVVLLTNKNRKIREVKVSEGSLTASLVHSREVYNPVIRESAAAVIFVHNHPSGAPAPSPEDIEITRRLKEVVRSWASEG